MIKKTWTVWALLLLLPGVVGLGIHLAQKKAKQNHIALAVQRVADSPEVKEYLDMYEQWSDLPAAQKANNPWGYGLYGGSDIQKRLKEGQSDRLLVDIERLEKGFTNYPDELTGVMYGPQWQQEIDNYRKKQATSEMILIGSIFLLASGGLILTGGCGKLLVVYLIEKRSEIAQKTDLLDEGLEEVSDFNESQEKSLLDENSALQQKTEDTSSEQETEDDSSEQETDDVSSQQEGTGYFQSSRKDSSSKSNDPKATDLPMKPAVSSMFSGQTKKEKDSYFGWAFDSDESTELETLMTNEPLTKELTELTEEVSAIRQFASQQQDQMRKLQDGYDWMIIRRFCLRIIRSIDNIDDRVKRLREQEDQAAEYLEDIRDELVFALEASGIEQFKPDLNISFKGLEKYAEAVRERAFTDDGNLVGCIAEVARPGYQYLVNDDDVKIVRCAQVKLYESKQT